MGPIHAGSSICIFDIMAYSVRDWTRYITSFIRLTVRHCQPDPVFVLVVGLAVVGVECLTVDTTRGTDCGRMLLTLWIHRIG